MDCRVDLRAVLFLCTASRHKFIYEIRNHIEDLCHAVLILDVDQLCRAVVDHIICSGQSDQQIRDALDDYHENDETIKR